MMYPYTREFIESGLTYAAYRQGIQHVLAQPAQDEAAKKMRPYLQNNATLMDHFDATHQISTEFRAALEAAPATLWLVLTEGWCGDAAFNVPMLAAAEKALPDKLQLRLFLRDEHLDLMDAHLTDGGRSIPKLIVLSGTMTELGSWGPRPAGLHELTSTWKREGLALTEIILKVKAWYDADATQSLQHELITLVKSYS